MKKIKNYIESDLAKKKISRYKFWAIKDEGGITIATSEDDSSKSFGEHLDEIIELNVDAEVQIKFGVNEQSARQNNPIFVKINETIEWVEPEDEEVKINGVPHKVDKNGNVNINLTTPEMPTPERVEFVQQDNIDFEIQLKGIKQEFELRDEKREIEMQNKLYEQTLKFKEMLLSERESRIAEREQILAQQESELTDKEVELQGNLKGILKQVPSVLGGIIKEFITEPKASALGNVDEENETPKPKKEKPQTKVEFSFEEEDEEEEFEEAFEDEETEEQESEESTETNNDQTEQ